MGGRADRSGRRSTRARSDATHPARGAVPVLALEAAAVWSLHVLGAGDWARLSWDATHLVTADVVDLLAAAVRLAALGLAWWCLLATLVAVAVAHHGSTASARRTLRLVPRFLRGHVERVLVTATAAGAVLAPSVALAAPLPPALAPQEVTTADADDRPVDLPASRPPNATTPRPHADTVPPEPPAPASEPAPDPEVDPSGSAEPSQVEVPPSTRPSVEPTPSPVVPPPPGAVGTQEPPSPDRSPHPPSAPSTDAPTPPATSPPSTSPSTAPAPAPHAATSSSERSPHVGRVPNVLVRLDVSATPTVPVTAAASAPIAAAPSAAGLREHVVRRGEHLWSIARDDLADHGADMTVDHVAAHWRRLVEQNRDRLGGDPDLVLPGQVVLLPAPPTS